MRKQVLAIFLVLSLLLACVPVAAAEPAHITAMRTTRSNAGVVSDGQTADFTLDVYNSSMTADQIWLAITVDQPDQAICMAFSNIAKRMIAYLYSASTLETADPTTGSCLKSYDFSSASTFSYKVQNAGVYYLMLRPYGSSYTSTVESQVQISLIDPDHNEASGERPNNDSRANATELTCNVNTYFTLNGANDVDWFKFTTTTPNEAVKIVLSNFDYTCKAISAYLYSGADLEQNSSASAVSSRTNISAATSFSYMTGEPGEYYLKLVMYNANQYNPKELKVRFESVQGDSYERNNGWNTATQIPQDGYEMDFTLHGENDVDYFYFETTTVNEVVNFYIRGFETDYSNKLNFYVYDINEQTGTSTTLTSSTNITSTFSKSLTCANVGGHYIKLSLNGSTPIENTLKLKIMRSELLIDGGEPNDTWQTATRLQPGQKVSFNLPASTDVDWFVISTTEPDQTVEFTLTVPVGGSADGYFYSGEALNLNGTSASALCKIMGTYFGGGGSGSSGAGVHTYRWKVSNVGDYYFKLTPKAIFEADAVLTYEFIEPDEYEYNDTWKTAAALNEGVAAKFTFTASNDVDWFKLTTTEPNQTVEFTLTVPADGSVNGALYSGTDFIASGDSASSLCKIDGSQFSTGAANSTGSGVKTLRWMLSEVGDYYLKINPYSAAKCFDEDATVTYRLIEPDEHERNNGWKTAAVLNEGIAAKFRLPASNDADWFRFTTTEPNQTVEFTLTIPDGGSVYGHLYSGADFILIGDSATALCHISGSQFSSGSSATGSGVKTLRWMLSEVGDYYFKIDPYSAAKCFDEDATVTYRLIEPDANESNNDWNRATRLNAQATVSMTLNAPNDYDWYQIDSVTPGDRVTVTFWNLPINSTSCALYYVGEYDTSASQSSFMTINSNTHSVSFNIQKEGTFFIRMASSPGFTDNNIQMSYRIKRDNIDVAALAVSSIGNAKTTIFQGKTLGLYPVFTPANATNQDVTWSSSNSDIVSVDENGVVTGVAPGTATITATSAADSRIKATCTVSVAAPIPVTGVTVTSNDVTHAGETEDNPKVLSLDTGIQLSYSTIPEGATEQAVTWSVSDDTVLSVTDYGKVYAVGSGTAYVTVTTVDGGHEAKYYISVPDESYPLTRLTLSASVLTIYMGEDASQLIATPHPSYATNQGIYWRCDDPSIAAVDEFGNVTPVSVGYTTVTVYAEENPAVCCSCEISVLPQRTRVTSASFEKDSVDVGIYAELDLKPLLTVEPFDATDPSVVWSSDNKNIATVSRYGVVTALNIGTVTITATTTDGQFVAEITVRVAATASLGDLNNDGDVDSADALLVLRYSVGLIALSQAQKDVGDLNGDGEINAGDAILLLRYDAGLITEFPAEKK